MTTHTTPAAGLSQCALILARLELTPGEWVAMPELARLSGSYVIHSRIADLRQRGHRIEHLNHHHARKTHSFYCLLLVTPHSTP